MRCTVEYGRLNWPITARVVLKESYLQNCSWSMVSNHLLWIFVWLRKLNRLPQFWNWTCLSRINSEHNETREGLLGHKQNQQSLLLLCQLVWGITMNVVIIHGCITLSKGKANYALVPRQITFHTWAKARFSASSRRLVAGKNTILSIVWMSSSWTTQRINREVNNSSGVSSETLTWDKYYHPQLKWIEHSLLARWSHG